MLSRIELGSVAVSYLRSRAHEVPHFEKNAQYIREIAQKMAQEGVPLLCHKKDLERWSEELALRIFKKQGAHPHKSTILEEQFNNLTYQFVVFILFKEGVCVGESLRKEVHRVAEACETPEELVLLFFRSIAEDVWLLVD